MSDGDPYNRRSNRQPNDQGQAPSWADEPDYGAPYGAPSPAQPSRKPSPRSGASQPPAGDYVDPARYPQQPPRRESDPYGGSQGGYDWPESGGAQWPERPYADPRAAGQQPAYPPPQSQRRPPAEYEYEDIDDWENEQYRKGRTRPSMPKISAPRLHMPESVSAAVAGQDSRLLIIAAGALLSLAAMAAVTANRVSAMDGWFPLHIDAYGAADWWGSPSTLWRLPLGLAMLTIMNVTASLIVGARDRHVAWVLIGSLPLIHLIGWIALIMIGW